jgi:hypothetical protein
MNVKYQIFISSTYKDLQEARRVLFEQVLNLGHIPVGMELFQAGDEAQWEYIKKRIIECDYYIVVVAERYGSLGPDGLSYTRMEYEFAVANRVPVAAFLLHEGARKTWPQELVEFGARGKIEEFRALCETRLVRHWRTAEDLGMKAITALVALMEQNPRIGWIRADKAAPDQVLAEIAKLSEEKRLLQERVATFESSGRLVAPPDIKYRIKKFHETRIRDMIATRSTGQGLPDISLLNLYVLIYKRLSVPLSVQGFESVMADAVGPYANAEDFKKVVQEFAAANLIETRLVQEEVAATGRLISTRRYTLTDYGTKFAMHAELSKGGKTVDELEFAGG